MSVYHGSDDVLKHLEQEAEALQTQVLGGKLWPIDQVVRLENQARDLWHTPGVTFEARRRLQTLARKLRWLREQHERAAYQERLYRTEATLREQVSAEAWQVFEELDDLTAREMARREPEPW